MPVRSSSSTQRITFRENLLDDRPAARNQLQNKYDERYQEEDVNKSSKCVRAHDSKQPQHQKNDKNRPKHGSYLQRLFDLITSTTDALTPMCGWRVVRLTDNCGGVVRKVRRFGFG